MSIRQAPPRTRGGEVTRRVASPPGRLPRAGATPSAPRAGGAPSPIPQRADGIELVGEFKHSGYKEPPWLVRRADGETVQLTRLLYVVVEAIDGRRDAGAIAAIASSALNGKRASRQAIEFLIDKRLRPLGLVKRRDGSNPVTRRLDPLLAVRPRIVLASQRVTRLLTAPFAVLFKWPIVPVVAIAFAVMTAWLLFVRGIGQSVREVLYQPQLLLITVALTVLSAGFHEFGHAAACRFAGARPGAMGAGLYLVWPVFFTDVTDSYRLSRAGRLCVDLGGVYFNAIFALGTFAAWLIFGWEAALVVVPLQLFQMLRQLLPFVRLDGYHILADVTGVPDLFARLKPVLLSILPRHRHDERVTTLKPWVRVVVTVWTLTVVPALTLLMGTLAVGLPRMLSTAWDSLTNQWDRVTAAFDEGEVTLGLAGLVSVAALVLPASGAVYMLLRTSRRTVAGTWRRTEGRPLVRTGAVGGIAAVAVGLAVLWWPNGEYRPIAADESMTVPDLVTDLPSAVRGQPRRSEVPTIELPPDTDSTDGPARPGGVDAPEPATPRAPTGSTAVAPVAPALTTVSARNEPTGGALPTPTTLASAAAPAAPSVSTSSGATSSGATDTSTPAPTMTTPASAPATTVAGVTESTVSQTTAPAAPAPAATTPSSPDAATRSTTATEETTP